MICWLRQWVHLPSKHETLNSNPNVTKKKYLKPWFICFFLWLLMHSELYLSFYFILSLFYHFYFALFFLFLALGCINHISLFPSLPATNLENIFGFLSFSSCTKNLTDTFILMLISITTKTNNSLRISTQ